MNFETAKIASHVFCGYESDFPPNQPQCPKCGQKYMGGGITLCVNCEAELSRKAVTNERHSTDGQRI